MSESALKTFLRGSAISLVGTGLFGLMNYFVRRTMSITLSVTDYGAFYSIFALLSMIYAFGDLGLNQSVTALIAKYAGTENQHRFFSALVLFRIGISFLTTAAVICSSALLCQHYLNSISVLPVIIVALMFFLQACEGCFRSLYNGLKEFGTQQIFMLLGGIFLLIGVLAVGKSLISAAIVFFAAVFLSLICNLIFCCMKKKIRFYFFLPKAVWGELFSIGGRLAVSTALFASLYHMDTVMLTFLKGEKSSALYNIALPIMQIVQAAMIFPSVMLPVAMGMSKQQDWNGLKKFALTAFLLALAAAPCVYLFFAWSGRWLVCFLFAEKYAAAAAAVPLLCSALVFYTLGHFLLQLLICSGAYNSIMLVAGICFGCNVILNYLLIQCFDFIGAGVATLFSYILFALSAMFCLLRVLKDRKSEGKEIKNE